MLVIGCDPGYEQSALVTWNGASIIEHQYGDNEDVLTCLRRSPPINPVLVIEQIESMGMAVGKTTFETVYWSGRFAEAWHPRHVERVTRRDIKIHLCGHSRATDANIRQALIDRFGPSTAQAIGTKHAPGPLYGITAHKLAALAVALTWADLHPKGI